MPNSLWRPQRDYGALPSCHDLDIPPNPRNKCDRLSTGIRALDHAVGESGFNDIIYAVLTTSLLSLENLYRPLLSHPQKVLCYAALADLFKYLPESKADPRSVDARQRLQVASWMSIWPMKREKYRYGSMCNPLVCRR